MDYEGFGKLGWVLMQEEEFGAAFEGVLGFAKAFGFGFEEV